MAHTKKTSPESNGCLTAPLPLNDRHDISQFQCGEEVLDFFLKERALKAQVGNTARTYVVCVDDCVVAYYSLAAGSVSHEQATSGLRRNAPKPIPCIVLARLAVDVTFQKQRVGGFLLQDAMKRALQASQVIGARTLVVHALNDEAAAFYRRYGFLALKDGGGGLAALHLPMGTIVDALG